MQGITDRDIAYDMLFGTKQSAVTYCTAALESATPSCLRTFTELQRRAQESQRQLWQFLHQRQEYRVSEAHPEEIRAVRERMEQLRDNHLQGQPGGSRGWETREPAASGAFNRPTGGGYRETAWNPVGPTTGSFNAGGYGSQGGFGGTANYGNQGNYGTSTGHGSQSGGRWESTQQRY